jgi:hypothetical protein
VTTSTLPERRPRIPNPRVIARRAWETNRPLAFVGTLMLLTLAVALVGIFVDPRVVTGAPAWLKPAKFAVSISIYSFTLLWLLTFVRGRPRLVRLVSWATAIGLGVEMALIAGAALLGTTSHFNVGTLANGIVWGAMAFFIVLTWTMGLLAAVLLLLQRLSGPAFAWGLRLGLIVSLVGMAVAFFMTTPTPEQLAAAEAGEGMQVVGAHSVGVKDGGPGLPILGWSTEGGDLRVPHFFGLHALQVLPLIGWLVSTYGSRRLGPGRRVALVWTAGLSYLGLVGLLTWQALRGQPLVAPDALTLGTLFVLAFAAVGVALAILLGPQKERRRESGGAPVARG